MKVKVNRKDVQVNVTIQGQVDALTAPELEKNLLPLITNDHQSITLDCSNLSYISSAGLRVFILAKNKTSNYNGSVTISNLNAFCKSIFDISGLTNTFKFV